MAAKLHRISLTLVIALGAYLGAMFIVLTRPGSVLSGDKRTVIRIAHWQIETGPREAVDAMIKRYEELNPQVRVEQVAVPGRIYKQWLRTQLIGGSAPDIIEFGQLFDANDIYPRFLEPISEYMEVANPYNRGTPLEGVRWRDTFLDGLNTGDTYIENLSNYYAVTLCMVTTRLFYNPALLQEISGSPLAPKTYTEMQALGEKLAQRNAMARQHIYLYAGSDFNGTYIMLNQLLGRAGIGLNMSNDRLREQGQLPRDMAVEFLRGSWDYRSPELLSGFELMRQAAMSMRPGFQQLGREAAMQEFLSGQAIMIVTGTWDATSLISMAPFKVAVAEFPWPVRSDGAAYRHYWGPVSEGAGNTTVPLCLNRASSHQKEAIDFLHFITSLEGNTIFFEQSGWLPSIREVVVPEETKVYLPHFAGLPLRTVYKDGFGADTLALWGRQLHHLVSAQGSVEKFLRAFEEPFPAALRSDLNMQLRHMFRSLQHELPALTALASLDRLQTPDSPRIASREVQESSQNITEARLYEALAVLEKGPAVDGISPTEQNIAVNNDR